MLRNDYRRSLILLRSNAAGYSGHVRLERRTLTGSMYFVLQTPDADAELKAALIGKNRDGSCFACALGNFRRENRGQTVLSLTFDPRNICGRELEQYKLIAVLDVAAGRCNLVLFGNLNGHADMDWNAALSAACALYGEQNTTESVNDLPEAEDENPAELLEQEAEPESAEEASQAEAADEAEPPAGEQAIPELQEESAEPETARNAGDALGIDMSVPWPDAIENLRRLFMNSPVLEAAPDDDHVYISVLMPQGCPYENCAVGIQTEDGAPAFVSYAMPSPYAPEPPEGMEDYIWQGDSNRGWWRFDGHAGTGKHI